MSYLGAISVIIGVYMIWREYSRFVDREYEICRAFLLAITDYREKVRCYMESPREWALGYEDECLLQNGFLPALRDGADFTVAYGEARRDICTTKSVDGILTACFTRLGEGYLEAELDTLDIAIGKLSCEEAGCAERLTKRRKATGALLGAFALGTVILII